jgi:hypothetical protein
MDMAENPIINLILKTGYAGLRCSLWIFCIKDFSGISWLYEWSLSKACLEGQ